MYLGVKRPEPRAQLVGVRLDEVASSRARVWPARTTSPTPTSIERITERSSGWTTRVGRVVISLPRATTTSSMLESTAHATAQTIMVLIR
jgi:hypothetical protein